MFNTQCYTIIAKYYGNRCAKRSGVRYINHIDEGLLILEAINATPITKDAYCIHPILQEDSEFQNNIKLVLNVDTLTVITAMEYRNVANRTLSYSQVNNPTDIYLSPIKDVNDMLIADKVQNRKDFLKYHFGTHPKSKELDQYFRNWLCALKITEERYCALVSLINS